MKEFLEPVQIEAHNLAEAWFLCIRKLFECGYRYRVERGSYAGQERLEFDFITICVRFPGAPGRLIPEVPPGIPLPTTLEYVESYLPYLMTAKKKEGEQYTYGQYLEKQIQEVIRIYKEDGYNTNQACMAVGNEKSIFLPDPPCLRQIDTRIKEGKLNFMVDFRSWDLWAGFPSNLAAIQLLKEYMVSEIKDARPLEDGEIIAVSKGLHLYQYSWDLAQAAVRYIESKEAS